MTRREPPRPGEWPKVPGASSQPRNEASCHARVARTALPCEGGGVPVVGPEEERMKRFLIVAAFLAGCVGDVGEGKVKAEVQDVPVAEQAKGAEAAPATAQLDVDRAQSKIEALGAK